MNIPLRARLGDVAGRFGHGGSATREQILNELTRSMATGTYALEDVLPRMAWTLAQCAGARQAVVWLRVGSELRPAASWPEASADHLPLRVVGEQPPPIPKADSAYPVMDQGELLGALSVTKAPGAHLSAEENRTLRDLAGRVGLVLRNVRLIEEIRASRQRIVEAADAERRKVERNLHDGAQQRLLALAMALGLIRSELDRDPAMAAAGLDEAMAELRVALAELRDLARGIHPVILTEAGLGPALESLADRCPVAVRIRAVPDARYPAPAEATVYYIVSEALANVAKYASAKRVDIEVRFDVDRLRVEVYDDGVGGAVVGAGSGLRGLVDRAAAGGGNLVVESPPGQGTRLVAEIPCA